MGFYDAIRVGASGAADSAYTIDRSLRFNDDDSTRLTRTLGSEGNRRKWTWSCWFKPSSLGAAQVFLLSQRTSSSNQCHIMLSSDLVDFESGGGKGRVKTQAVFRDVSAWYHLVLHLDSDNSTASDRVKIYINGVQQSLTTQTTISTGDHGINNNNQQQIGAQADQNNLFYDGYLAEINFIDGQAYDASYFGETNAATGQWNPKEYTGSYGSQGFYLNFSDNSGTTATTLGKDSSGNGNNFTPNNFSVSAGVDNDSVEDTPTNNWCTLNPLDPDAKTISDGNLKCVGSTGFMAGSNFVVTSGKWYMEVKYISGTSNHQWSIGFSSPDRSYLRQVRGGDGELTPNTGNVSVTFADPDIIMLALDIDNGKWYIGKNGSYMLSGDPVNGTGFVHSGLSSSEGFKLCMINNTGDGSQTIAANFGQQGFSYTPPTNFKALNSANLPDPTIKLPNKHFDTLLYTGNNFDGTRAITGYSFQPDWIWTKNRTAATSHNIYDEVRGLGSNKEICSDKSQGEGAENGAAYGYMTRATQGFNVVKGSDGTNGNYNLNRNGDNYAAWAWNAGDTDGKTYTVKVVSDGGNKYRFDDFGTSAVTLDLAEGGTYIFDGSDSSMASHPIKLSETSNGTHGGGSSYNTGVTYLLDGASVTESAYVSGYASATTRQLKIVVAASAPTLYYYCHYHSGMGGQANTNSTLGSSNFDGTLQATVKANTTAGFSITAYSGNDSNAQTVGHGLGVAPDVIILKSRTAGSNWRVWHKSIATDGSKRLILDSNNQSEDASFLNDTAPTSTIFTLGNSDNAWNASGNTYISYLFSEVAGYSKFGKYTGNGSSDGTFVFTGFRPAWIMIKRTDSTNDWHINDYKRDIDNTVIEYLYANTSAAQNNLSSGGGLDFLSNGFKIRNTSAAVINGNGADYIYLAFAEAPFKNARAR